MAAEKTEEKKQPRKKAPKAKAAEAPVTAPAVTPVAAPTSAPVVATPVVAPAPVAKAPAPTKKKRAAPKKGDGSKTLVARGKRKTSIARATISKGKGVVRFNSQNVSALQNKFVRDIILEPLRFLGPEAHEVDISVSTLGGGMMGQAQAARTAIANALVLYFDQAGLKEKFIDADRSLVVEDTRRVESKKFRGPKARARFQKSYR